MICKKTKCIFIHVPKCAGQSVEAVFLKENGLTWSERHQLLLRVNRDPEKGPPRLAHLTAREYVELGYINKENFSEYFKFGVVRNPYARLVSEYKYRGYFCSFETFVVKKMPKLTNDHNEGRDYKRHITPQVDFFKVDGSLAVDQFVKFEDLASGFSDVSKVLNLEVDILPRVNVSGEGGSGLSQMKEWLTRKLFWPKNDSSYRSFYNDKTKQIVADIYSEDFEVFDYDFE
ncbi:MAG: sulfotransferase family 2 domain-containing protein [Colwellia sp.]|jgi:Sulfotransferase family.